MTGQVKTRTNPFDQACPYCGEPFNRVTSVNHTKQPDPGDRAICLYCRLVCAFCDDLTLRPLDRIEAQQILNDPAQMEQLRVAGALVDQVVRLALAVESN